MESQESIEGNQVWSWADMMSTYRFWGLLVFYVLALFVGMTLNNSIHSLVFREKSSIGFLGFHFFMYLRIFGVAMGIYLAWAAIRTNPVRGLIIAGILEALGLGVVALVEFFEPLGAMLPLGIILFNIPIRAIIIAIIITVPALLAQANRVAGAFVIVFGVLIAVERLSSGAFHQVTSGINLNVGAFGEYLTIFIILAVGIGFLIPVKRAVFTEKPPDRLYELTPKRRNPVGSFFLIAFIPLYVLYWLYRIHGEVLSLGHDRELLSPRASVGIAFVPMMAPIMSTTLIETINRRRAEQDKPRLRSPVAVFIWTLLVMPVGFALVQSALNKACADRPQSSEQG